MGKCISKDQQIKIREIDERSYIAISTEFEYYRYEDDSQNEHEFEDYDDNDYGGQSESKKSSSSSSQGKKMHGPETKGTSISFGFKKKNHSTANKKQHIVKTNSINNNNSTTREREEQAQKATIISNLNVITAEQNNFIITGDNNGNTNPAITTASDEKEFVRTTSPAKLQPAKRDQLLAGRSNRFGFRQNVIRPTSGAITPKFNEFDNVNNNSGGGVCRAKSATTTQSRSSAQLEFKTVKPNSDQHTTTAAAATAVRQNEVNANSISSSRPTSAAVATATTPPSQNPSQSFVISRYTLQSTSLPRPQYPVSVSVTPSYPTFARNTTAYSSLNTSRTSHSVQSKLIDTKGAKHQANLTKRGGMMTRRDESLDSGIASHDSTSESYQHQQQQQQQSQPPQSQMDTSVMRRSRRRFEMIPGPGRHKFEIRDLNDYNENAVVVPLSLPKLPTDRREIVTNGLIRSTNSYTTDNETDMSISESSRPTSLISTASETESFEEEKLKIDTSCSEKSLRGAIAKENVQLGTKRSSPSSWRSSSSSSTRGGANNNSNGGESMAMNVCSNASISISESSNLGRLRKKDIDYDEEELSSMTITADHSSYLNSMTSQTSPSKDQKETVNDAYLKQQQQHSQPKVMGSISRKELFIQVDEVKFAETVAASKNLALLDDETSPSDSLVSSTNSDSGDAPMKKVAESKHKKDDEIKEEEDLEDVTPELVDLVSPCSPTHASNSLSLSDGGREDFLIDDEIADQPALMISASKKRSGESPSRHDNLRSISNAMNLTSDGTTTTPTLRDMSHGSLRSLNKLHAFKTIKSDQSSPAANRKAIMERSGSLDTLSPCDSIASDDLMADFDLASSIDSIDRHEQFIDDLRVNSENDCRNSSTGGGGGVCDVKEYGAIFRHQQSVQRRHSSRENITSQLPARATRLLNRRLQNTNNSSPVNNGSESPRSLDSMHSRASARASLREHLKQRQQQNLQSQLLNASSEDLLADKSLRNSMLQDVSTFKKQLVQLRRILQEDEDKLMMSDTLNPFEINGHVFSHLNGGSSSSTSNGAACENEKEMLIDDKEKRDDEKNVVLTNEQLMLLEDQRQELADLRRQVVFLQTQVDDKDRLIRQQQYRLDELRMDNMRLMNDKPSAQDLNSNITETANCATQTERLRPVSMGGGSQDFNSQQDKSHKDETKPAPTITVKQSPPRSKTQISSVYTKLSSIKPTATSSSTLASGGRHSSSSSIPTTSPSSKPMKSTKIEHPKVTPARMQSSANVMRSSDLRSPLRRSIPQLVKTASQASTKKPPQRPGAATASLSLKGLRIDDSNGNSATSSLSTSSSNSSINDRHNNKNINSSYDRSDSNGIGFLAHQLNEIYSRGLLE